MSIIKSFTMHNGYDFSEMSITDICDLRFIQGSFIREPDFALGSCIRIKRKIFLFCKTQYLHATLASKIRRVNEPLHIRFQRPIPHYFLFHWLNAKSDLHVNDINLTEGWFTPRRQMTWQQDFDGEIAKANRSRKRHFTWKCIFS